MKRPPLARITKQAERLFPDPNSQQAFIEAMEHGLAKEQAIVVLKEHPQIAAMPKLRPLSWQPSFVHRILETFKVAHHPLFTTGAFYPLDFSSVFSASAMLALQENPNSILDVCSAPGGKAVFACRAFKPERLVCNEVVRKRVETLRENLERCGISAELTSLDPSVIGRRFKEQFEFVMIDAPCSGQSMLAKGGRGDDCYDSTNLVTCVQRQHRVVGHACRAVKPGGHLLYMTCTFEKDENERVVRWLMREYPEFQLVPVPHLQEFRTTLSDLDAYRLYPHQGLGAGAFTALLKRNAPDQGAGSSGLEAAASSPDSPSTN